jgi:hypothetical protein
MLLSNSKTSEKMPDFLCANDKRLYEMPISIKNSSEKAKMELFFEFVYVCVCACVCVCVGSYGSINLCNYNCVVETLYGHYGHNGSDIFKIHNFSASKLENKKN